MPEPDEVPSVPQMVETSALAIGRAVLGRELNPEEAAAMKLIFQAAAQALSEGFIQRLARHVQAERGEETIEEFFEDRVKAD